MLRNPKQTRQDLSRMHKENLRLNLERRIEAARERGDEELLRQLEAEARYIG